MGSGRLLDLFLFWFLQWCCLLCLIVIYVHSKVVAYCIASALCRRLGGGGWCTQCFSRTATRLTIYPGAPYLLPPLLVIVVPLYLHHNSHLRIHICNHNIFDTHIVCKIPKPQNKRRVVTLSCSGYSEFIRKIGNQNDLHCHNGIFWPLHLPHI